VESLLHRHHSRQWQLEDLPAAARLAARTQAAVVDVDSLDARDAWEAERVRDAHADLVVAGVRRLVAEQEQVERLRSLPDGLGQRGGRRLRVPVVSVRLEK